MLVSWPSSLCSLILWLSIVTEQEEQASIFLYPISSSQARMGRVEFCACCHGMMGRAEYIGGGKGEGCASKDDSNIKENAE